MKFTSAQCELFRKVPAQIIAVSRAWSFDLELWWTFWTFNWQAGSPIYQRRSDPSLTTSASYNRLSSCQQRSLAHQLPTAAMTATLPADSSGNNSSTENCDQQQLLKRQKVFNAKNNKNTVSTTNSVKHFISTPVSCAKATTGRFSFSFFFSGGNWPGFPFMQFCLTKKPTNWDFCLAEPKFLTN